MKKIFLFSVLTLVISCKNKTPIQQIDSDLKGMLENKVEVQNLIINRMLTFSENGQKLDSISFDAELYFTDDLFADDFKFNKGMKVSVQNSIFIYDKTLRLISLKFGKANLMK